MADGIKPGLANSPESTLLRRDAGAEHSDPAAELRDAAGGLRDAAGELLKAAADRLGTVAQQGEVAAAAEQLRAAAEHSDPAAELRDAAADRLGTVAQQCEVVAAAEQPRAAAEHSDPAGELRDAAGELLADRLGTVAQQGEVAAAAEQLRAAADRLGTVAHRGKVAAAEQLRAAAGRLETAAGRPADESLDQGDGTADRLDEAANDVRTVRLGLTALSTADLADLEELELYRTEKKLQDTRDKLLRRAAKNNSGVVDFEEITNLVIIDRYPKLKKALDLWYQRDKDLKAKIAQKEARRSDVRNQIYNIIGWYAVYLGVVLTAVSQLTQTNQAHPVRVCRKAWFPSVLTALGFLATIGGLYVKFGDLSSLESTISDDRKISDELNRRALELGRQGLKFNFLTGINLSKKVPTNTSIGKYFVYFALLAFAGVFILSYFVILCDTGT